jgi:ribose/xylose/arabinose/galactoside ABC-type transport system permease subunit
MIRLVAAAARSPVLYLVTALVLTVATFAVLNDFFFRSGNLKSVASGAAPLGVIALGVTIALACGAIDFSVAGNAALAGVVAAWVDARAGGGLGILAGLATSTGVGVVNGVVITATRINAFIATLAAAGALRGFAFLLAGSSIGVIVEDGPIYAVGQKQAAGLPGTVWTLLVVVAVAFVFVRYVPLGRRLLAVGGNPEAARLAGMASARLQVLGYTISGLAAGIGGILLAGRAGVAIPQAATGTELLVFSAVLLGGTSLWGGRASVVGSLAGVLLLNVLYNGLVLERISTYWQTLIQGALLIVAVWLLRPQQDERDPGALVRRYLARRSSRAGGKAAP